MDFAEDVLTTFFSCLKCDVEFTDSAKFDDHIRSDSHMNFKSPNGFFAITLEDIEKKAIDCENEENEENEKIRIKKKQKCKVCRKKFSSYNQLENHLASKTHRKKLNATIDAFNKMSRREWDKKNACNKKKREEETDSDEECVTNLNEWNNCLFCDFRCQSTGWNLEHMASKHSFHVPDLEYCSNLSGLLKHLEHKISSEFKCIWCNDSGMQSAEAAKMHMIDKGHCSMFYGEDAIYEYLNFYDYSYSGGIEQPDIEQPDIEQPDIEQPDIEQADAKNDGPEAAIKCQFCRICGLCHLCTILGFYSGGIEQPDIELPDIELPDIEQADAKNDDPEAAIKCQLCRICGLCHQCTTMGCYSGDIEQPDIEQPDIEQPDIEQPDIELPDIEQADAKNDDPKAAIKCQFCRICGLCHLCTTMG